jgi:hypothetical protein
MAATVKIDGQTSKIDGYEWAGDEPLTLLLNSLLDPAGPSGGDPNPEWTAANEAIKQLGGEILSFDRLDFDSSAIY